MIENLHYLNPFRTDAFGYDINSIVDMTVQQYYDGSVNIITVCENKLPRIVNSRQRFNDDGTADIVVRGANDVDNIYSDITINKTILIPGLSDIIPVLSFTGVIPSSGRLLNGGYKYYFKFRTSDGNESPLAEESRLVSIHNGTKFGKSNSYIDNTITRNSVQFTMSNIDAKVYKYVSVYYVRATGQSGTTIKSAYHINRDYEIISDDQYIGTCSIAHTGFESETPIDITELISEYSPITSASTITQKNNRLILGNIKTQPTSNDLLKTAALCCYMEKEPISSATITQRMDDSISSVTDNTYANPSLIYKQPGFFPGETYELAINYVFTNGTVSPSYPIMGMDYTQHGIPSAVEFDVTKLGIDIDWVSGGQNSHGVVRMKYIRIESAIRVPSSGSINEMFSYTMYINTTKMVTDYQIPLRELGVTSYFITRRKRIPDLLMEGLLTLTGTAPISSMYPVEATNFIFGGYAGYGLDGPLAGNLVLFPLPGSAMPFSGEGLLSASAGKSTYYYDGVLYAPIPIPLNNKYFAFYSPDITCDTAATASINDKNNYGIIISSYLSQKICYKEQKLIANFTNEGPTRYPYCANPYTMSPISVVDVTTKLRYIDDGSRSFSSLDFTGRLDRQTALALYTSLRSYQDEKGNVGTTNFYVSKTNQNSFYTDNITLPNVAGIYKSYGALDVSHSWGSIFPHDVADPFSQIPMSAVKYSPYLGIILKGYYGYVSDVLSMTVGSHKFSLFSHTADMVPEPGTTKMGAMAGIYNNEGGMLKWNDWKAKYSIKRDDGYFTISERFNINQILSPYVNESLAKLKGGDCYSGFYFQRVWRPAGIDGVPTANNPRNYSYDGGVITRNGANITNSGYAIGFPVRSAFNFALRALDESDDVEMELYGKGRTYTSSEPIEETHGNRQPETSVINYGNILEESVIEYKAYSVQLPYIEINYPNRVVVSEISNIGEFENGFRTFQGLNFKDYDLEQGDIVALCSVGLYTYIVFQNGVSLIEVSERVAVTSEASSTNVYIASSDVLPPKATPIFHSTVGSQHLKSIISTEDFIFGVDVDTKKIWGIIKHDKKVVSDHLVQALLNQVITKNLKNVITSYNAIFNELCFTFVNETASGSQMSLVYNSESGQWYGTSDIHRWYQFIVDDKMLSLQRPHDPDYPEIGQPFGLYFPVTNTDTSELFKEVGKATAIDDRELERKMAYDSYLEFVIKTEQFTKFNLSNIIINGNAVPTSIDVISESLHNYTIETASALVSGIKQNMLPIHTNIYMRDALMEDLTTIDLYRFKRKRNVNFKDLSIGDRITLDLNGSFQQLTIANITEGDANDDIIIVNHAMINSQINALYIGWSIPLRVSLGEVMSGKIKITIPTKKHADALAGITNTAQNNHVNYASAKPYGRWIKLRLNFSGIEQIYVESVISEIVLHFS